MTHSLDGVYLYTPQSFMTQSFRESVVILLKQSGVRYTAELLEMLGVSFDNAYELIFNRLPSNEPDTSGTT